MTKIDEKTKLREKEFINYVFSFYGRKGLYGDLKFTKKDIKGALEIRKNHPRFSELSLDYDSADREVIRDIVLKLRDPLAAVEFDVNVEGYLLANKLNSELNEAEPTVRKKPKI